MWGIVIAYMLQSRSLYSDNAMLLVRWCFYAMIIFTILSVKGDLTIQREGDIKDEPVKGNAPGGLNHETIRLFVFIVSIGVYLVIMEWLGSVSYTHLDVYKRQYHTCQSGHCTNAFQYPGYFTVCVPWDRPRIRRPV